MPAREEQEEPNLFFGPRPQALIGQVFCWIKRWALQAIMVMLFLFRAAAAKLAGLITLDFSSSCRPSIVSRFNFVDIQNLLKFIYGPHSKKRFSATLTSSQREKQNRLSDFFVLNANEFLPLKTRLIDFFFRLLNVAIWSSLRMHSH